MDWSSVRRWARSFADPIDAFDPDLLPELAGIADGAGLDRDDVLALNLRTEVLYGLAKTPAAECTAVAALPPRTAGGTTLLAQNWDWYLWAADTCVLLVAEPDDGPGFATLVEAGLVAKTGLNEAGVGVATNALSSGADRGQPGVPYHAILRRILSAQTFDAALAAVADADRASSANYLVADDHGRAADLEAAPDGVWTLEAERGVLTHANHFVAPDFSGYDRRLDDWTSSSSRHGCAAASLAGLGRGIDRPAIAELLADHRGHPGSVCAHPDPFAAGGEASGTVASVVMDLPARSLWATAGPPCRSDYMEYRLGDLLAGPAHPDVIGAAR
jgi:isopenicillin-N N-acyltransferase like protein